MFIDLLQVLFGTLHPYLLQSFVAYNCVRFRVFLSTQYADQKHIINFNNLNYEKSIRFFSSDFTYVIRLF
jgi:hypothetical protein